MAQLSEENRRKGETWSLGDYSAIGSRLVPVSERLCDSIGLRSSWSVLDVATGTGNTALAVSRHGCAVSGIDISAGLLERARARAQAEGLEIDLRVADVEQLPFEDRAFDAVVSTFGLMFAPSPASALSEIARVCRPGARLAITSWSPVGANAIENEIVARYVPGDDAPSPWASPDGIREVLSPYCDEISVQEREVVYRYPSVQDYVAAALDAFGPFMRLRDSLKPPAQRAIREELITGLEGINQSGDATMVIPFPYFEVVASLT